MRFPWLRLAAVVILLIAFVLAVRSGRTIEAVVVGVFVLLLLVRLAIWVAVGRIDARTGRDT